MFREAANLGANVIVGLNSDEWLTRKKGKPFMEWDERAEILESCKFVNQVLPFDDSDETACDIIKQVCSLYRDFDVNVYFANGGDRNNETTPEKEFCDKNDIETLFGIGGNDKSNSSSWILKKWKE